jgi:hypothetical protein
MKCARCGFESDWYPANGGCSLCGSLGTTAESSVSGGTEIVPWESKLADESPLRALAATFRNSLVSSRRFFSKISTAPKIVPPLIYGLTFGTIGMCAATLWNCFPSLSSDMFLSGAGIGGNHGDGSTPGNIIATPLILLAKIFLCAAYVHTLLFITRSSRKPFRYTFKTICYAEGAMLFQVIPLIGPMLWFFGWAYLVVSGVRSVHGISGKRASLVLLLPTILLAISVGIAGAIIMLVAGAMPGMHPDPFSLFK